MGGAQSQPESGAVAALALGGATGQGALGWSEGPLVGARGPTPIQNGICSVYQCLFYILL